MIPLLLLLGLVTVYPKSLDNELKVFVEHEFSQVLAVTEHPNYDISVTVENFSFNSSSATHHLRQAKKRKIHIPLVRRTVFDLVVRRDYYFAPTFEHFADHLLASLCGADPSRAQGPSSSGRGHPFSAWCSTTRIAISAHRQIGISPRHHRPTVRRSLPIASASSSCDIPERASNSLNSTAFTKSSLRKIEKILALRWSNHKVQNVPK